MTALELDSAAYHADDTGDTPTLSASIAQLLITRSPAHAKAAHPKLNPDYERETESKWDIGTAAHSLLLEGIENVHIVQADNWRTKAAQEERDEARANGRVPLLANQWDRVRRMVDAANRQLDNQHLNPRPFTDGTPEVCIAFDIDGVKCRALVDWVHTGGVAVADYKTTSAIAHPAAWGKTALAIGADIQVVMHSLAVEAAYGSVPEWVYVVQETYEPFALSVLRPAPSFVALGTDKVRAAVKVWRDCLTTNRWPGYPMGVSPLEPPPWAISQWLENDDAGEVAL